MRQIFVREGYRGKGIGKELYYERLKSAAERGLKSAKANIRKEAFSLHNKFNAERCGNNEYYIIRGI